MREMKDSGVAWIGKIPINWKIVKLNNVAKRITDFVASGSFEDLNKNVTYLDEPDYAMLVRTADLSGTKDKRVYINQHAYEFLNNSNLYGGEIILSNIGSVGNVFVFSPMYERSSLAPNAIMIDGCENNKFVYYWFLCPIANNELKRIGGNAVQLKFNKTQLRQFKVLIPPPEIQERIVRYLDRKCSAIDNIISKQEQIIEKLKEYKLSLITEAVTKGLDSDVEMKDSGTGFIGMIPRHWNTRKVKGITNRINVGVVIRPSEYFDENGTVPFLRGINVKEYEFVPDNMVYISEESNRLLRKSQVQTGDILVVRDGAIGVSCIVPEEYNGANVVSMIIIGSHQCFDSQYICYCLNSAVGKTQFDITKIGSALTHTSVSSVSNISIPFPDIEEQKMIVEYLGKKVKALDVTIIKKRDLIEKLNSYKKSLIYEVVTGKKEV